MVPKKSDELIKATADELGLSEKLVSAVKTFYWKDVRKAISDMRYHSLFIENLGTFKVKSWKLEETLKTYTRYTTNMEATTFRRMTIKMETENRMEKIRNLLTLLQDEVTKKQSVKDKRNGKDLE